MVLARARPGLSALGLSALATLARGLLNSPAGDVGARRRGVWPASSRSSPALSRGVSSASSTAAAVASKLQALHPRNSFQGSYDMPALVAASPGLASYVVPAAQSRGGRDTVDFSSPAAVKALNQALLAADYGATAWTLPAGKLCPPIPGRADYMHHLADVLQASAGPGMAVPTGPRVRGFDVGTGASFVYPLLGAGSYGWSFVASDVDAASAAAAALNLSANLAAASAATAAVAAGSAAALPPQQQRQRQPRPPPQRLQRRRGGAAARLAAGLAASEVRQQNDPRRTLRGVLLDNEEVDFVCCNPPFYESREAFLAENLRKQTGLEKNKAKRRGSAASPATAAPPPKGGPLRLRFKNPENQAAAGSDNFGGGASELWCPGGEVGFVARMAAESQAAGARCLWFSCLVSRATNLPLAAAAAKRSGAVAVRNVAMGQGQKASSLLLWTFVAPGAAHAAWAHRRGWAKLEHISQAPEPTAAQTAAQTPTAAKARDRPLSLSQRK